MLTLVAADACSAPEPCAYCDKTGMDDDHAYLKSALTMLDVWLDTRGNVGRKSLPGLQLDCK